MYGTLTTLDMLATATGTTVYQYGEDRVFDAIETELALYNNQLNEGLDLFVERTTDKFFRYGATDTMKMQRVDQLGTPRAQKVGIPTQLVGVPLWRFALARQWTRTYFERSTPREIARQTTAALKADRKNLWVSIQRAVFQAANHLELDELVDNVEIPVKALLNADGTIIPAGQQGKTFNGASHTHYSGTASFVDANLAALVNNVSEHYDSGNIVVYINAQEEPTVRTFAGFVPITDDRITRGGGVTTSVAGGGLDTFNIANRLIGVYTAASASVWVKPWVPAGYVLAFNAAGGKILRLRTYDPASGNFGIRYEDETHPLRMAVFEREFGLGVLERERAAVLYTGGGAYVDPVIPD